MISTTIPYGYKIEKGKAVPDTREAEQVKNFFDYYLSGLSIKNAKDAAGIPVCVRTANNILQREVYLGNEYYPAIIDKKTFDAAAVERENRREGLGNRKSTRAREAQPVQTRFKVENSAVQKNLTPAQKAVFLYSLIIPAPEGTETIEACDRAKLHKAVS